MIDLFLGKVYYAVCVVQKFMLSALYSFDINIQILIEIHYFYTAMSIDTDDNTENDINISNISRDKPKETSKESIDSANLTCNNMAYTGIIRQEKRCKKARSTQIYDISSVEEKLRVERLKKIIKQEQQLAEQKLQYEKVLFKIKEDHLQEINKLELNHIKETHNIQLKIQKMK